MGYLRTVLYALGLLGALSLAGTGSLLLAGLGAIGGVGLVFLNEKYPAKFPRFPKRRHPQKRPSS